MTNKEIIAELTRRINAIEHANGWKSRLDFPEIKTENKYLLFESRNLLIKFGRYCELLEMRSQIQYRLFIGGPVA